MTRAGSPHSDTLGSQPASRLPEAYRRPPRPSSAPDAKASTERPKKQNTNPTKDKQTTDHTPTTTTHQESRKKKEGARPAPHKEQRYSRPLYRSQPTHPPQHPPAHHQQDTTQATPGRTAPEPDSTPPTPTPPTTSEKKTGQDAQPHHTHAPQAPRTRARKHSTARRVPCTTNHHPQTADPQKHNTPRTGPPPTGASAPAPRQAPRKKKLPRKEVIQPHLPVRLPCYDFVPITSPTFDRSPQGHGLRVSPAFMT